MHNSKPAPCYYFGKDKQAVVHAKGYRVHELLLLASSGLPAPQLASLSSHPRHRSNDWEGSDVEDHRHISVRHASSWLTVPDVQSREGYVHVLYRGQHAGMHFL